jgi:hypothetical protein
MPPPTEFGGPSGGQFWGDYTGLTVTNGNAHPVWSDTRAVDVFLCPNSATGPGKPPRLCTAIEPNGLRANDQEMFTDSVDIPTPPHGHR